MPTTVNRMLPPMRAEFIAVANHSSMFASRYLSTKALMLAVSSATWMPNCASQGATVVFRRSASSGICSRSSGSSFDRIGTISSATASTTTISANSTSATAATRGNQRAASRSTAGCSA